MEAASQHRQAASELLLPGCQLSRQTQKGVVVQKPGGHDGVMGIAHSESARAVAGQRPLVRYLVVGASGYIVNLTCFSIFFASGAP
jgi:hypothetical protein